MVTEMCKIWDRIDRKKLGFTFVCTLIFWVVAHGYRFMNNLYVADTLTSVFQDDIYWERSLGRFMHPLPLVLRGTVCAPWLIGMLAVLFYGLTIYLVLDMFRIRNRYFMVLICGVLICNQTLTINNIGFLPWVDVYACALFLAVLGVWYYLKNTWQSYLCGSIALVCCMGYYQAYIDVALVLIVMLLLRMLWSGEDRKRTLLHAVKMMGATGVSAVWYFVSYKLVCRLHHVTESGTYNGLTGLGDYSETSIGGLIVGAYETFFDFLANPGVFVSTNMMGMSMSSLWQLVLKIALGVCVLAIVGGIVYLNCRRKTAWPERLLQGLGLLVLPLAANFVYVLSKGMEHELMIYSFFLTFVFLLVVLGDCMEHGTAIEKPVGRKDAHCSVRWNGCGYLLTMVIILFIWNNIVFSNQVYFKIDMADRAGLSMATRIAQDIESREDYEPGVTQVAFVGSPDKSDYVQQLPYLREIAFYGAGKTPFTYEMSLPIYLKNYLNVNINVVSAGALTEEMVQMPAYPAKGYIQYVGDVLVVKISE